MSRIAIDPDICNGQPVVAGTRITARTILEFLAAGDSIEAVLEEYPNLTREDVLACLEFSAEMMGHHFSLQRVASKGSSSTRTFRRSLPSLPHGR